MFERFTERARQVVVLAQEEARTLKHNYIGTEHILLGLAREGEGVGAQVLDRLGASPDRVLTQVLLTRQTAPREELRRVAIGEMPQVDRPRPGNIREVLARLDEISGRLSAIENLLAEMQKPMARAGKPPAGEEPPEPAQPPAAEEPPEPAQPSAAEG